MVRLEANRLRVVARREFGRRRNVLPFALFFRPSLRRRLLVGRDGKHAHKCIFLVYAAVIMRYRTAASVLSSVEFRGLPLREGRDRKEERKRERRRECSLCRDANVSATPRQGATALLCPMHNAEVLIIMVMRGEIRSMQMQGLVRVSLDTLDTLDIR